MRFSFESNPAIVEHSKTSSLLLRPSWEIAPYFAFIDLHFVLSQASISLTIKQGHSNEGFFL